MTSSPTDANTVGAGPQFGGPAMTTRQLPRSRRANDASAATPAANTPSPPPTATASRTVRPGELIGVFYDAGFHDRTTGHLLAAIEFFQREGHLRVPPGHRERDINLYAFITRLWYQRRVGLLADAQVAALNSIGMRWSPHCCETRRALTAAQRVEVVRRYTDDEPKPSIRALAAEFGCSYGTINNILREARAKIRPRGGPRTPRPAQGQR
jgi:hypothetical protein